MWQSEYQPVRRENHEARIIHVNEGHHDRVVGSRESRSRFGTGATFIAICQGCFVAMVAVGNDQFLPAHLLADRGNHGEIGNLPDAMEYAVFVRDLNFRRAAESSNPSTLPPPLYSMKI